MIETFCCRVLVIGGNTLIDFFRAYAYSVGFKFTLVPEMGLVLRQRSVFKPN